MPTAKAPLVLAADPIAAMEAATKQYVDSKAGSGGGGSTSEIDYAQIISPITGITVTSEATAQTLITGNSVVYDGATKVKIEAYIPKHFGGSSPTANYVLLRDSTVIIGSWSQIVGNMGIPVVLEAFDTPPSGAHTYTLKVWVTVGNLAVSAGPGGSGAFPPAYLRVTKDPAIGPQGPPGVSGVATVSELDYQLVTGNSPSISATTEAAAVTIITGNPVTYDGSTRVRVELLIPDTHPTGELMATFVWMRDSVVIGQTRANIKSKTAVGWALNGVQAIYDTPPAGSHTYSVKVFVDSNAVVFQAGGGGAGTLLPLTLRVSRDSLIGPQGPTGPQGVAGQAPVLDYQELASDVALNTATEGVNGVTIVTFNSVTFDGSPVEIEMSFTIGATGGAYHGGFNLIDLAGPTNICRIFEADAAFNRQRVYAKYRFTPSVGSKQYRITGFWNQSAGLKTVYGATSEPNEARSQFTLRKV